MLRANVEFRWKETLANDSFPRNVIFVTLFADYYDIKEIPVTSGMKTSKAKSCYSLILVETLSAFNLP
jgi:hypothetical protein